MLGARARRCPRCSPAARRSGRSASDSPCPCWTGSARGARGRRRSTRKAVGRPVPEGGRNRLPRSRRQPDELSLTTAAEEDLWTRALAARNALRLAQVRYEAGYSAYLEVLDAQRTANDAELAVVRNRQNRLSASVDLMKSLGGGWSAQSCPPRGSSLSRRTSRRPR